MSDHTVTSYDRDLEALELLTSEMGDRARDMVGAALDALADGDLVSAQDIVASGRGFFELQRRVEAEAILTIARRSPVSVDLRSVIGALRVAGDLGRVAKHSGAIADCAVKIGSSSRLSRGAVGLRQMGALATELLDGALGAYRERDVQRARQAWEGDAELDALEGSVCNDLLARMIGDPRDITFCAHALAAAKAIERIGDHATNIAETVVYVVTGDYLDERRRGGGTTDVGEAAPRV